MINQESISRVNASLLPGGNRKPLYDSYSFSKLPESIFGLLTGNRINLPSETLGDLPQEYDKVITVFVDAFGWVFWERFRAVFSILKQLSEEGVVSKLTSQFPSTTAAHVTTIHSGLEVAQHGVYEWRYFEPKAGKVICPLSFASTDNKEKNSLDESHVDPSSIFPTKTLYQRLGSKGISSQIFLQTEQGDSKYNDVVMNGATVNIYEKPKEGIADLVRAVKKDRSGYYFLYYGNIDRAGHHFSPDSTEFEQEVQKFCALIEILLTELSGKVSNTLLVLVADHGQTTVDPAECFYLNEQVPEILKLLKSTSQGELIVPEGSPRDFFLHIDEDQVEVAHDLLSRRLEGVAEVQHIKNIIDQGFFGSEPPSHHFLNRLGNLLILPKEKNSVWWREPGKFEQKFKGLHGGLHPDEMEIPLIFLKL